MRDATGALMPAADALAAAGLSPVQLGAKEGLALINGTDGMLGMLVLAITDLRRLLRTADIAAAMSVEAQMGTDRVFAAELQALQTPGGARALGRQPDPRARRLGGDGEPPRGPVPPGAGRVLAALLAAGARRRPRHRRARRDRRRARAGQRGRQPGGAGRRRAAVESNGNFHGAPGRLRPRLPGHRRRRRRLDLRAPQRPLPRPRPQPRPAAVPRRRPRRRQRPDDRAVHPGRDRLRAQAARGAGQRRLDPVERDAGGPRLDGLERRPQAASVGRRADPGRRHRADDRGPRPRAAHHDRRHRRHDARAGHRGRRTPAA